VKRPATAIAPVWLANFRIARYQIQGKKQNCFMLHLAKSWVEQVNFRLISN